MKNILNVGCGKTRIPNSIGLDSVRLKGYTDVVHDLNTIPYPFKSNSFNEVHLYHVLEHLEKPLAVLEELHRIMKKDGILHIRTPHFSSKGAFTDPTHIRPFAIGSFDYFEPSSYYHFYTKVAFIISHKQIYYLGTYSDQSEYARYIMKFKNGSFVITFERMMNWLINGNQFLFERFWCYWVGGANEIYVAMKKSQQARTNGKN